MRAKVFTLASVALLSCRAVLGIEELDGDKDGGSDAKSDAPVDGGGGGGEAGCSTLGVGCGKCCRDNAGPAYREELEVIVKGTCACDGGPSGCAQSCASNLCSGGDPKDTPCLPCIDDAIREQKCTKTRDDCYAKSAACKTVYDCLASCP